MTLNSTLPWSARLSFIPCTPQLLVLAPGRFNQVRQANSPAVSSRVESGAARSDSQDEAAHFISLLERLAECVMILGNFEEGRGLYERILELRTEAERQERLLAYLRNWAPHLQKVETQHRRAAGHGSGLN